MSENPKHIDMPSAIENIILFGMASPCLEVSKEKHRIGNYVQYEAKRKIVPMSTFSGCEVFYGQAMEKFHGDGTIFYADAKPRDVDYKFDNSVVHTAAATLNPSSDADYLDIGFTRVVCLPHGGRGEPPTGIVTSAIVSPNGQYKSWVDRFLWQRGQWVHVRYKKGVELTPKSHQDCINALWSGAAIEFNRQYQWRIEVGLPSYPTISLKTDSTGAKEIIEQRTNKSDRKAALRSWVDGHWRKNRNDPDIEIYVRKCLRGATRFEWNGLLCNVVVPPNAQSELEKAIADRKQMRKDGTDRRRVEMANG